MKLTLRGALEYVGVASAALGIAFYAASGLAYAYFGSRQVTHKDFWYLYELALTQPSLHAALLKYGGHSLFFPTWLWLLNLRFLGGHQQPLVLGGMLLLVITVLALLIPIWRDHNISFGAKIISTFIVVAGNFWMGRYTIMTSGGFNCICSLVTVGASSAFLMLQKTDDRSDGWQKASGMVVLAAFVGSFSFGSGLAIWPTLLLLAWCSRLGKRSMSVLILATVVAAVIFVLLPTDESAPHLQKIPFVFSRTPIWLCEIIGSPPAYAVAAWRSKQLLQQTLDSSISVGFGVIGVTIAFFAIGRVVVRRDIQTSGLRFTALALVIFALGVGVLIATALPLTRVETPNEFAPRYLFWSTLFWAGLLLLFIAQSEGRRYLRLLASCLPLAIGLFMFPSHHAWGQHARDIEVASDNAATSLIDGVRDSETLNSIAPRDKQLPYVVAPLLRARRLDMFANGLQDWIGQPARNLFDGRHRAEQLHGSLRVEKFVSDENGQRAARIIGKAFVDHNSLPQQLVLVNQEGTICGVARAGGFCKGIDKLVYGSRHSVRTFLGYIRNYDPKVTYVARSADEAISDEAIVIEAIAGNQ